MAVEILCKSKPFTVLFRLPDDIASDQNCAADTIYRVQTNGKDPAHAVNMASYIVAQDIEYEGDVLDIEPVAVYAGHLTDLFSKLRQESIS